MLGVCPTDCIACHAAHASVCTSTRLHNTHRQLAVPTLTLTLTVTVTVGKFPYRLFMAVLTSKVAIIDEPSEPALHDVDYTFGQVRRGERTKRGLTQLPSTTD